MITKKVLIITVLTILCLAAILFVFFTATQKTNRTPESGRTFGGAEDDHAYSAIQTDDGGLALAGSTESFGVGGSDFWLIKVDANRNTEWSKTYGGTGEELARSVVQTTDDGYALVGHTSSFGAGGLDFWLVKIDTAGEMQWNKTFGGTSDDYAYSIVQTNDGGYALAGFTASFGAGNRDLWLVKVDADGNPQWNKTYGGADYDGAYSLIQTSDGGYALAGITFSFGAGSDDFYLVKTDANGNIQWNKTYGGTNADYVYSVTQTSENGYAIAGSTMSFGAGSYDFWLVKTDSDGQALWNRTYGGANVDSARSLILTIDNGYALVGNTKSQGAGGIDFWLVKTDANGNAQWNKTYGGTDDDCALSVIQSGDGEFIMTGFTASFGNGGVDVYLIETSLEPTLTRVFLIANNVIPYRLETDPSPLKRAKSVYPSANFL